MRDKAGKGGRPAKKFALKTWAGRHCRAATAGTWDVIFQKIVIVPQDLFFSQNP